MKKIRCNIIIEFNIRFFFFLFLQTGAVRRPTVIVSAGAGRSSHIGGVRNLPDAVSTLDGTVGIGRHDRG